MTGELKLSMLNSSAPAIIISNNLLTYYPNYTDSHTSGIATLFFNLVVAFPCLNALSSYPPICKVFTFDDDGFRNGHAIIEASDMLQTREIICQFSVVLSRVCLGSDFLAVLNSPETAIHCLLST